jgi:UDP-glucose-4-epimerase GalE
MNILVTGGAGYVGSHAARLLHRAGHDVWVFDNLSTGHRGAALPGRLIVGQLADRPLVEQVLREKEIEAVMHFAASASVGESMVDPAVYYRNNIVVTIGLLDAMRAVGARKIVFSSTTATYGVPRRVPIAEDEPQAPINPYGYSKMVIEHALRDYARAYGMSYATLRYFNAAGAAKEGDLGETQAQARLIAIVLQVPLGQRKQVTIFGDDYPTPDGTCIRDYVHVEDLGDAHLKALEALAGEKQLELNLGVGHGHSVLEVIAACRRVTGHEIPSIVGPRRDGDPPELVADARRARSVLGWQPVYTDLDAIVETAWRWHRTHPHGFNS